MPPRYPFSPWRRMEASFWFLLHGAAATEERAAQDSHHRCTAAAYLRAHEGKPGHQAGVKRQNLRLFLPFLCSVLPLLAALGSFVMRNLRLLSYYLGFGSPYQLLHCQPSHRGTARGMHTGWTTAAGHTWSVFGRSATGDPGSARLGAKAHAGERGRGE